MQEVVPGDLVLLSAGDRIPGDCRITESIVSPPTSSPAWCAGTGFGVAEIGLVSCPDRICLVHARIGKLREGASDDFRKVQIPAIPAARCGDGCPSGVLAPPGDIYRTHQGWLIKLELAGVSPGDLEVTVAGRRLQVAGRRRDWCIREGQRSYQMEIAYNRFEREFELPFDLKVAELETEYVDGMLLITLKAETGEP